MSHVLRAEEIPVLFRKKAFHAADLARAVNYFVVRGEKEAVRQLLKLAPDWESSYRRTDNESIAYCLPERVGWVLRILYLPKKTQPLRQPYYGGLNLPYLSMPLAHWPLYPIAASGGSYFVLGEGYVLSGEAEPAQSYLEYCRTAGRFRERPILVPTRQQAQRDATSLWRSTAWKRIRWSYHAPWMSYDIDEKHCWRFIQAQADSIPTS